MSRWFATAGCVALALLGSYSVQTIEAQGPIREGARRTGEAVAEGGRAVAEGTRSVVRGTAEGAGRVLEGTAEGTRRVLRGTAEVATGGAYAGRETRYDEQGRPYYIDTQPADQTYVEGQPQGDPALQPNDSMDRQALQGQQYESGYRGVEGQGQDAMPTQQLLHDRCGRAFICDNGHRVYLNDQGQSLQAQQHQAQKPVLADEPQLNGPDRTATRPMMNDNRSISEQSLRGTAGATNAPPVPEGATARPLDHYQGTESQGPARPQPNLENPGKSNIPGQQPGDNADSSTTNSSAE